MPDAIVLLQAMGLSAAVAVAIFVLFGWSWRSAHPVRLNVGGVVAVAFAFYLGCWWLGYQPRWPPAEDQDRFLLILLPATAVVEVVAAFAKLPREKIACMLCLAFAWACRLTLAAAATRILLHNSVYLADLAGPDTREWSLEQTGLWLSGLAIALAIVWILASLLQRSCSGPSTLAVAAVALTCTGAGVTIMLSGYASGGSFGLPLAAALFATTAASLLFRSTRPPFSTARPAHGAGMPQGTNRVALDGVIGVGIVGLFGLLVMGRFFGGLTTTNAVLLLFPPLLCWIPEAPYVSRLRPWMRGVLRPLLVMIPVAVALGLAAHRFNQESGSPSDPDAPTLEDYLNFKPESSAITRPAQPISFLPFTSRMLVTKGGKCSISASSLETPCESRIGALRGLS